MKSLHAEIINPDPLTRSQSRVLVFICEGYTRKEIARLVNRSYGCVSKQVEAIALKLEAHSAAEIVAKAVARQLIKLTLQCVLLSVTLGAFSVNSDMSRPPRHARSQNARYVRIVREA